MYPGSTPKHTYKLPIDTSTCNVVQVTYTQGDTQLVWQSNGATLPDGMTFDEKKVIIRLTQEQTFKFEPKKWATSQVRVLTTAGDAFVSKEFKIDVKVTQNKEILKWANQ